MWLVDENLHKGVVHILERFGIRSQTVRYAGFDGLSNGHLTRAAFKAGFETILTRDKTFAEDAKHVLEEIGSMSIVVVNDHKHLRNRFCLGSSKHFNLKVSPRFPGRSILGLDQ